MLTFLIIWYLTGAIGSTWIHKKQLGVVTIGDFISYLTVAGILGPIAVVIKALGALPYGFWNRKLF